MRVEELWHGTEMKQSHEPCPVLDSSQMGENEEGEGSLGTQVLHKCCGTLWKREMLSAERYIVPMDEVPFLISQVSLTYINFCVFQSSF